MSRVTKCFKGEELKKLPPVDKYLLQCFRATRGDLVIEIEEMLLKFLVVKTAKIHVTDYRSVYVMDSLFVKD